MRPITTDAPTQFIEYNSTDNANNVKEQIVEQQVRPQEGVFKKGETIRLTAHFENAKYYQWYHNGKRIEDCTGNTLIIENAILKNTGLFSLVVANEDFETTTMKIDIV